jgi:hypothetical protein
MIEACAFAAMFTLQILVMSVLQPRAIIAFCKNKAAGISDAWFAANYPGVDRQDTIRRLSNRYLAANLAIALLGLALLAWMLTRVPILDWDQITSLYFLLQALPLLIMSASGLRGVRALRQSMLDTKRKADLRRRRLFDFVSPFTVALAAAGYPLFIAYVLYIDQRPFPGFGGAINIAGVTLVYALQAFGVWLMLYGRKSVPFESHAARMLWTGPMVRAMVYCCILTVVSISIILTLQQFELRTWKPVAISAFLVLTSRLCYLGLTAPPRRPDSDGAESPISV